MLYYIMLVLVLSSVSFSRQHLSNPINFCNMASTCIHDGRGVCASSPDGCSRRSFLDQCDMYEYNCDYGTQYMTKVSSTCTSDFNLVDCEEKCPCCHGHMPDKNEGSHELTKTTTDADDHIRLTHNTQEMVIYSKEVTVNCDGHSKCRRPKTWATTARGETRDFFRILNSN